MHTRLARWPGWPPTRLRPTNRCRITAGSQQAFAAGRTGSFRSSRHSLPPRRRSRTLAERTPFTLRRKSCQERKSAAYCESCVSFAQTQVFSQHVVNRVLLGDPPLERHPHGKRSAGGNRSTLARRPAAVRRPCSRWSATNSSTSSARFIAWLPGSLWLGARRRARVIGTQ